jgi:short-subunit dehydrogenase involved in D-alanine esterification of teichoic acids
MDVTNRTIFIAGATSGIGLEIARRFAAAGSTVIVCGRRTNLLDQAGAEGFATEVMDLLQTEPTPHEFLVKGVLMHRWAERDGTYDDLVAQRSQALAMLPGRH